MDKQLLPPSGYFQKLPQRHVRAMGASLLLVPFVAAAQSAAATIGPRKVTFFVALLVPATALTLLWVERSARRSREAANLAKAFLDWKVDAIISDPDVDALPVISEAFREGVDERLDPVHFAILIAGRREYAETNGERSKKDFVGAVAGDATVTTAAKVSNCVVSWDTTRDILNGRYLSVKKPLAAARQRLQNL